MRQAEIIAVGKVNASYFRDGCAEYLKRIGPMCRLTVTEIPESKLSGSGDAAERQVIEAESRKIEEHLSKEKNLFRIAMCIEGKQMSSEMLAELIGRQTDAGKKPAFIIGGSLGLSDELKNSADLKLSMSEMTFPHQLARLMLLEQIYRALTILGNIKYHK